ncbi:MAG: FAD-binding protein, partial [Trebonia sp.]
MSRRAGASSTGLAVPTRPVRLTGWGRIAPTRADLAEPASDAEAGVLLRHLATTHAGGTAIARGLGRSYNNAAQSAGGLVISTGRLNNIIGLDTATGIVVAQAGVSLEQLMVAGLPHGWFVP